MKKLNLLFALLLSASFYCQAQNDDETPYEVKQFNLSGQSKLEVEITGGNISVDKQQGAQTKVEMYVKSNRGKRNISEEEIKERLQNFEINISQEGNTLKVNSKPKRNLNWDNDGLNISFKVFVPQQVSTEIEVTGGNTSIANLTGKQEVHTTGGNISLNDITGDANVRCTGGNISLDDYKGKLAVDCSGGNISLDDATGEIEVRTAGGNISITGMAGSVMATTSGGNIQVKVDNLEKYLTLSTSGGNISADIPTDKGLDVDIRADHINTNVGNFKGYLGKDKVQGTINGGGIPVKMHTSGGNISLN